MPTIIRKSQPILVETRREVHNILAWQVRSNVWRPPTDIYETDDGFVVKIEVAGLRDEDLEVIIESHLLLISGGRVDSSERRAYHQMEIPFGKFSLAVDLPTGVKTEGASAEYKDGFLTIQIPKEKVGN